MLSIEVASSELRTAPPGERYRFVVSLDGGLNSVMRVLALFAQCDLVPDDVSIRAELDSRIKEISLKRLTSIEAEKLARRIEAMVMVRKTDFSLLT